MKTRRSSVTLEDFHVLPWNPQWDAIIKDFHGLKEGHPRLLKTSVTELIKKNYGSIVSYESQLKAVGLQLCINRKLMHESNSYINIKLAGHDFVEIITLDDCQTILAKSRNMTEGQQKEIDERKKVTVINIENKAILWKYNRGKTITLEKLSEKKLTSSYSVKQGFFEPKHDNTLPPISSVHAMLKKTSRNKSNSNSFRHSFFVPHPDKELPTISSLANNMQPKESIEPIFIPSLNEDMTKKINPTTPKR